MYSTAYSISVTANSTPYVFLGGTSGLPSLADPIASKEFRSLPNTGFYLHYSATDPKFARFDYDIARVFFNKPQMVELSQGGGFNSGFWTVFWRPMVLNYGFQPSNALINIDLEKENAPSALSPKKVSLFKEFVDSSNTTELKTLAPLFAPNDSGGRGAQGDIKTLCISHPWNDPWWDPVREIILYGKAAALDSPPAYFLHGLLSLKQIQAYKQFDIDVIKWARNKGIATTIVISPFFDAGGFAKDAIEMFELLQSASAMPDTWVVENYNECGDPYMNPCTTSDAAYRTPVGTEQQGETVAGVALKIATRLAHSSQ